MDAQPNQYAYSPNLLMDDLPYVIPRRLALILGMNRALVLQHLWFLMQVYRGRIVDSKKWIHMTDGEWEDELPMLSRNTIRGIFEKFAEQGLVQMRKLDSAMGDQTTWYTCNREAVQKLQPVKPERKKRPDITNFGEWRKHRITSERETVAEALSKIWTMGLSKFGQSDDPNFGQSSIYQDSNSNTQDSNTSKTLSTNSASAGSEKREELKVNAAELKTGLESTAALEAKKAESTPPVPPPPPSPSALSAPAGSVLRYASHRGVTAHIVDPESRAQNYTYCAELVSYLMIEPKTGVDYRLCPKCLKSQAAASPVTEQPAPAPAPVDQLDDLDLEKALAQVGATQLLEGWNLGAPVSESELMIGKWYLHDVKNRVLYGEAFKSSAAAMTSALFDRIDKMRSGLTMARKGSDLIANAPKLIVAQQPPALWVQVVRAYYSGIPLEFRPAVQDTGKAMQVLALSLIQSSPTPDLLPGQIQQVMAAQYASGDETTPEGYWRRAGTIMPFKTLANNFNLWRTKLQTIPAPSQAQQAVEAAANPYLQDPYFARQEAFQPELALGLDTQDSVREIESRHQGSWQMMLGQLELQLSKATFDNWLKRARLIEAHDLIWTIGLINGYQKEWLEKNLLASMRDILSGIHLGRPPGTLADERVKIELVISLEPVTA